MASKPTYVYHPVQLDDFVSIERCHIGQKIHSESQNDNCMWALIILELPSGYGSQVKYASSGRTHFCAEDPLGPITNMEHCFWKLVFSQ